VDDGDEERPKRITKKRVVRVLIALAIAGAATAAWAYVRYGAPKASLGGPCKYAMNCTKDAPRCMRESEEGPGVCSRTCDADAGDCAPDVRCVVIELDDERDERGVPIKTGYCFPQAFLDTKKAHKREAGAPVESWIDVPEGRLEGEIALRWERAGAPAGDAKTFQFKGALLHPVTSGKTRLIVDTAAMRLYTVDDEKKTFAPTAIEVTPGDLSITKTGRKEKVEAHDCEIWQLGDAREACVVLGGAYVEPGSRAAPVWMHELAVRGALPLRLVERSGDGKETARLVATRYEPRPIDANVFVIPKTYKNQAAR
jgi:hypothetical protein